MTLPLRIFCGLLTLVICVCFSTNAGEFQKSSSDTLKLNYKCVSHSHTPKGISALYQLFPENFPRHVPLKLIVEMLDGSKEIIENLQINENGNLIKTGDAHPFLIARENMALGEFTRYTLSNLDGTRKTGVTIVPLPIEVKDFMGHRISIELLSPDGMGFLCHGEGFLPFEQMKMISVSGKEATTFVINASSDGKFVTMLTPAIKNQESGHASVEVFGRTSKLKVHYKWGRPATQPYLPPGPFSTNS